VKSKTVRLSKPIKVSLPANEKQIFEENIALFDKLGFDISKSGFSFSINRIPELYKDHDLNQLIAEVIHNVSSNYSPDTLSQRTLSFLACRSAIKAGDELTNHEGKRLLEKLYNTKTNYTCPHGRPVLIELPLTQLHIAFRRK
jgi:DNA mismatch repair protein MutL